MFWIKRRSFQLSRYTGGISHGLWSHNSFSLIFLVWLRGEWRHALQHMLEFNSVLLANIRHLINVRVEGNVIVGVAAVAYFPNSSPPIWLLTKHFTFSALNPMAIAITSCVLVNPRGRAFPVDEHKDQRSTHKHNKVRKDSYLCIWQLICTKHAKHQHNML